MSPSASPPYCCMAAFLCCLSCSASHSTVVVFFCFNHVYISDSRICGFDLGSEFWTKEVFRQWSVGSNSGLFETLGLLHTGPQHASSNFAISSVLNFPPRHCLRFSEHLGNPAMLRTSSFSSVIFSTFLYKGCISSHKPFGLLGSLLAILCSLGSTEHNARLPGLTRAASMTANSYVIATN